MTVRLRAHHLLCMLTFVGEGYNPAFIENYRGIAKRLSAGEEIELVSGPDDICAPLLTQEKPHCVGASVIARDEAALTDVGQVLGRDISPGSIIVPDAGLLAALRGRFASGYIRQACRQCDWEALCSRIADDHFTLPASQPLLVVSGIAD
ncbi:MAG: DUF1284 domain-containing protein [Rhizobiaceae bacterium]|nr:DUF1284 domain-containing protein [Rhizobiaceae bacterium]